MPHYYDATAIKAHVSRAIKEGKRGTQSELARAVGVPQPTVNKWKKEQTCPSHEYWPAIERHFGWDEGTLAGVGGMTPTKLTPVETALLQDEEMTDKERAVLLDMYYLITGRRGRTPQRPASIPT